MQCCPRFWKIGFLNHMLAKCWVNYISHTERFHFDFMFFLAKNCSRINSQYTIFGNQPSPMLQAEHRNIVTSLLMQRNLSTESWSVLYDCMVCGNNNALIRCLKRETSVCSFAREGNYWQKALEEEISRDGWIVSSGYANRPFVCQSVCLPCARKLSPFPR